eukprot:ANDGO_05969.mRNA.1 hypothetical protein
MHSNSNNTTNNTSWSAGVKVLGQRIAALVAERFPRATADRSSIVHIAGRVYNSEVAFVPEPTQYVSNAAFTCEFETYLSSIRPRNFSPLDDHDFAFIQQSLMHLLVGPSPQSSASSSSSSPSSSPVLTLDALLSTLDNSTGKTILQMTYDRYGDLLQERSRLRHGDNLSSSSPADAEKDAELTKCAMSALALIDRSWARLNSASSIEDEIKKLIGVPIEDPLKDDYDADMEDVSDPALMSEALKKANEARYEILLRGLPFQLRIRIVRSQFARGQYARVLRRVTKMILDPSLEAQCDALGTLHQIAAQCCLSLGRIRSADQSVRCSIDKYVMVRPSPDVKGLGMSLMVLGQIGLAQASSLSNRAMHRRIEILLQCVTWFERAAILTPVALFASRHRRWLGETLLLLHEATGEAAYLDRAIVALELARTGFGLDGLLHSSQKQSPETWWEAVRAGFHLWIAYRRRNGPEDHDAAGKLLLLIHDLVPMAADLLYNRRHWGAYFDPVDNTFTQSQSPSDLFLSSGSSRATDMGLGSDGSLPAEVLENMKFCYGVAEFSGRPREIFSWVRKSRIWITRIVVMLPWEFVHWMTLQSTCMIFVIPIARNCEILQFGASSLGESTFVD